MKFTVKVGPNAKQEVVEQTSDYEIFVKVKEPAVGGRANEAAIRAIADHFDIPKSRIRITAGHASRTKIVEIT